MRVSVDKLKNAMVFQQQLNLYNMNYKSALHSSYINQYQNRMYQGSLVDYFLLNYKVSNENYDFAASLSRFRSEPAKAAAFIQPLEEAEKSIMLPKPAKLKGNFFAILKQRKSVRKYVQSKMKLLTLSTLLCHSFGVKEVDYENNRLYPRAYSSGGGLYPISFYLYICNVESLENTFYKYQPYSNTLLKLADAERNIDIRELSNLEGIEYENINLMGFMVYDKRKNYLKYGDMALPMALIEIGAMTQTLFLIAGTLGMGVCELGGFNKKCIEKKLRLDGIDTHVLSCLVLGSEY